MNEYKLWKAKFEYSYQGSDVETLEDYVVTIGDSLKDVEKVLSDNSSRGVDICAILEAKYMGLVILPKNCDFKN